MKKKNISLWVFIAVIIILFIFSSYITNESKDLINKYIDGGFFGMLTYLCVIIAEIIFAPVNPLPLVPIATGIWGWKISGMLTLIGWTIGSLIAFGIAKKSLLFLEKRDMLEKIRKIENIIPERNIFLGILILRLAAPFDLISYGIGLVSKVNWKVYTLATFIGYAPLAFILAYLGTFSVFYQIVVLLIGTIVIYLLFIEYKKGKKLKKRVSKLKNKFEKKFKYANDLED